MLDLKAALERAVAESASDVLIVAGASISMKREGVVVPLDNEKLLPPHTEELIRSIYELSERSMDTLLRTGDDDFSFGISGLARFRVNAFCQRNSLAAVVRIVSFSIPDWIRLGIPSSVMDLSKLKSGLVLVTGATGAGKSTTLTCLIDRINQTRACHIITLEDPIEFLHRHNRSIVSQREIAVDSDNYASALRACLRQSPDVIVLGDMRDIDTIRAALTAAETGHLVFATLHTHNAATTIDRIVDVFPARQQEQIRIQLSTILRTVVSQSLLPARHGGRVCAFEIMHANSAIQNLIREQKTAQIENVISTSSSEGMQSMDQSIYELYTKGLIDRQTALSAARSPDTLVRRLGGSYR